MGAATDWRLPGCVPAADQTPLPLLEVIVHDTSQIRDCACAIKRNGKHDTSARMTLRYQAYQFRHCAQTAGGIKGHSVFELADMNQSFPAGVPANRPPALKHAAGLLRPSTHDA